MIKDTLKKCVVVCFMSIAALSQSYAGVDRVGSEFSYTSIYKQMGSQGRHGELSFTFTENPSVEIWDSLHPYAGVALMMAKALNYNGGYFTGTEPCGVIYTCLNHLSFYSGPNANLPNRVRAFLFLTGQSYNSVIYPFVAAETTIGSTIGGGFLLLTTGHTQAATTAYMLGKAITYTTKSIQVFNVTTNRYETLDNIADNISFQ